MPCYVIQNPSHRADEAILCDPCDGPQGYPDRKTDVPVAVKITETTITIDDEPQPRRIISCVGHGDGTVTYMLDGSSAGLRNRKRRVKLERASELLKQAGSALMVLKAESDEPEVLTGSLGELWNWMHRERERASAKGDAN